MAGYRMRRNGSIAMRYGRVNQDTGITVYPPVQTIPARGARQRRADVPVYRGIAGLAQRLAGKLVQQKERTNGSAGANFGVAAVAFRQPRQQRVLGSHRHAVPAEHAPEEMSQTVDSIRDAVWRRGRLERADIG